jgi:hypothetical protein
MPYRWLERQDQTWAAALRKNLIRAEIKHSLSVCQGDRRSVKRLVDREAPFD